MTEIESGVLIDDWKTNMSNFLSIDKSRINYIEYEGAGLVLTFTITEDENDNIDDLFIYINNNYSQISEIYPYVYKRGS